MPYENSVRKSSLADETLILDANRRISSLQTPYSCVSPYISSFHLQVINACSGTSRLGNVGLRVCKAVVVGDVGIGKTSFVNRFCKNIFNADYKATIGVDFEVERFCILGMPFTLQIWDTAGQERFKCIAASYYRASHIVVVMFSYDDPESLANVPKWASEATENSEKTFLFVVGTKSDAVKEKCLSSMETEAKAISQDLKAEFWSVSSKTGANVLKFFARIAGLAFDNDVMNELKLLTVPMQEIQLNSKLLEMEQNDANIYESSRTNKCCT